MATLATILGWLLARSRSDNTEKELRGLLMQPFEQGKAVQWMAQQGIPYLTRHLEGDDRLFRNAATLALGHRKGDREATRLLLALCAGDDVEDAGSAAIALAIQGEPEAREAIARFVVAEDPRLREGAVNAIAACRDESLYPFLDVLAGDADGRVRSAAQNAIARLTGSTVPEEARAGER